MKGIYMIRSNNNNRQRGAVSLFVVIFSALLITVLTLSFIRIMVRDSQQASDDDLSRSAYDSAVSGVEDAKRALLLYQHSCNGSDPAACKTITDILNSHDCTTLQKTGIVGTHATSVDGNTEVSVQQLSGSGQDLNQAYTCVTVDLDTPDYLGTLKAGESHIIPLISTDPIQAVEVSWFSYSDFSSSKPSSTRVVDLESKVNAPLYAAGNSSTASTWPKNRPSLVRAQLMQYDSSAGFTLSDFDNGSAGKSDANTLFLYPSLIGLTSAAFTDDTRYSSANSPELIKCNATLADNLYACTTTIDLPEPVGGSAPSRTAYLRLSALYNQMTYSVKLKRNGGTDPASYSTFNAVQPSVDSTGRANDLFRRVQSRIELTGEFPYPDATIDLTGNLCKNFMVTTNPDDDPQGITSGDCKP